jgi:hypothetical protein
MLSTLAGTGLSTVEQAAAKNLSCINEISPNEQRLLRDCEPTPTPRPIIYVLQVVDDDPPPPAMIKNGESKGGGAHGRGQDHEAPAGGGGPNGAAN